LPCVTQATRGASGGDATLRSTRTTSAREADEPEEILWRRGDFRGGYRSRQHGCDSCARRSRVTATITIPLNAVVVHPEVIHVGSAQSGPPNTSACERTLGIACYEPAQIQQAYDLGPLLKGGVNGNGQTIVIVDSFGSPTIAHDLTVFDRSFKLPAPPPSLLSSLPGGPSVCGVGGPRGWAGEATLDVEWAHVMAPGAKILLLETPTSEDEGTSGFPQIVTAELYAIKHHLGGVISQSFGATEQTFPPRRHCWICGPPTPPPPTAPTT